MWMNDKIRGKTSTVAITHQYFLVFRVQYINGLWIREKRGFAHYLSVPSFTSTFVKPLFSREDLAKMHALTNLHQCFFVNIVVVYLPLFNISLSAVEVNLKPSQNQKLPLPLFWTWNFKWSILRTPTQTTLLITWPPFFIS